jgi:hypothetical protein
MSAGEFYGLETEAMTGVVNKFPRPTFIGASLFPKAASLSKTVSWDIKTGARTLAKYSTVGAEAHISKLQPRSRVSTEIMYLREKKVIDENTKNFIEKAGTFNVPYGEQLLTDELEALDRIVENTKEKGRWDAIVNGQIDVQQIDPNLRFKVDYAFDSDHKVTNTSTDRWSDTTNSNPMSDIMTWKRLISKDAGIVPSDGYCTSQVMQYMVENSKLQTLLQYTIGNQLVAGGMISTIAGVNIQVYDVTYVDDAGTVQFYIPEDKFILLAKPGLGKEFFGPIDVPAGDGVQTQMGKVSYSWSTKDPVDQWILVGDSYMPAIQLPDQIVTATI